MKQPGTAQVGDIQGSKELNGNPQVSKIAFSLPRNIKNPIFEGKFRSLIVPKNPKKTL